MIVNAAIGLADLDGLEAVSLRKVAAALEVGPMRLYGYISAKEDLFDLMADVVYGELSGEKQATADWKASLRQVAYQMRRAAQHHRWFVNLLGNRLHHGPNALHYLETLLANLHAAPGFELIDTVAQAFSTFSCFLIGALHNEAGQLRAVGAKSANQAHWDRTYRPYINRLVTSGQFTTIVKVNMAASSQSADGIFHSGLETVLDGIALRLAR
jgi:AcrR family transcriptional regulator